MKTRQRETGLSPKQLKWWFVYRRKQSKCLNTKCKQTDEFLNLDLKKWQIKILTDYYESDSYPLGQSLTDIADKIKLNRVQVFHWFKVRRDQSELDDGEKSEDDPGTSSSTGRLPRRRFTDGQWEILVDYYDNTNPYPTRSEMKSLAKQVDATRLRVKGWFVDRRRTKPFNKKHRSNERQSFKLIVRSCSLVFDLTLQNTVYGNMNRFGIILKPFSV